MVLKVNHMLPTYICLSLFVSRYAPENNKILRALPPCSSYSTKLYRGNGRVDSVEWEGSFIDIIYISGQVDRGTKMRYLIFRELF